jgi:hypothetical protein
MNLDGLQKHVDDMIEVLQAERRAVASLDVDAINALTAKKVEQLAKLETLMASAPKEGPGAAEVRHRVARVSIEAEANAHLIWDALAVVQALLGLPKGGGLYNARGAIQSEGRSGVARSI